MFTALGEEADFEALNCQPSTKFDTADEPSHTSETRMHYTM
jgi:hypothetical protein